MVSDDFKMDRDEKKYLVKRQTIYKTTMEQELDHKVWIKVLMVRNLPIRLSKQPASNWVNLRRKNLSSKISTLLTMCGKNVLKSMEFYSH